MIAAWLAALGVVVGDWLGWTAFRVLLANSWNYLARSKAKTIIYSFIGTLFAEAASAAMDSDDIRGAIILHIAQHTGLQLETLDVEGAKKAAGKLLADKLNEQYGTTFESFYPTENIIDNIRAQIELEIVEALSDGQNAAKFKLFSKVEANTIGMRIINGYKQAHDLPIIGLGVIVPQEPKRIANRERQATYRDTHSRLSVWATPDTSALLTPVIAQINLIRAARKEYNVVKTKIAKDNSRRTYLILHNKNTAAIDAMIAANTILLAGKLAILNAAIAGTAPPPPTPP